MNNYLARMSRRERLGVLLAALALLAGGVLYPAGRAAAAYRREKLEELQSARELNASYRATIAAADRIQAENRELQAALDSTDGLLFDHSGNEVMMDAGMVKQLDQMAPDLDLEVDRARSSLHDLPGQMNYSIRGDGRYPELLNFLYQLETHRPLMVINSLFVYMSGRHGAPPRPPAVTAAAKRALIPPERVEPHLRLQMEIEIHSRHTEVAP